jgi:AcrR family transcriptional regulator
MNAAPSQLGRPVGASGERTRARIITATMRCVAEVGYSRASIREIARAADMTSGSLYHYFPNKSELLTATVREIDDIALPRLRAAAARSDDVVERLEAVLDELDRLLREYPHLAAFERAMRGHAGLKRLRDTIDEIVRDARARGALPPGTDPGAAVNAIYALARGLTDRAANLTPEAYAATLDSAKELIRGTLFAPRANRRASTAPRRSKRDP